MIKAPGILSLDSDTYEGLKQHVVALKQKQQESKRVQDVIKEVETAAVLQLKQQYETSIRHHQLEVQTLQQQLRQHVDRSAKLRQRYERERKALAEELNTCKTQLSIRDSSFQKQLAELVESHNKELEGLQRTIQTLENLRVADRKETEAAKEAAICELDQFATGEIEAVKTISQQNLQRLTDQVLEWQTKHTELLEELNNERVACALLEDEVSRCNSRLSQLQADALAAAELFRAQLKDKEREVRRATSFQAQYEKRVFELQVQHAKETEQQKVKRYLELQQIEQRLQQVITKKDGTIKTLKGELQVVNRRLVELERLLAPSR